MQKSKFVSTIIAAVLLAGALGACSAASGDLASPTTSAAAAPTTTSAPAEPTHETTTTPPAPKAQELAVVESAFGKVRDHWWYVVIVENPNPDYIFDTASLTFEAVDSAGTILDSGSGYTTLLSGKTAFSGTFFDVGEHEIATLNARGPVASDATKSDATKTGSFTIADVAAKKGKYSTDVSGILSSTFANEQELVEVTVVARDAAGKIVGAEATYVERLPVSGKVQFSTSFLDDLPANPTFEAYAAM